MDIKRIKTLVEIMNENRLTRLEIVDGETKILFEKAANGECEPRDAVPQPQPVAQPMPKIKDDTLDFNNVKEINSPIVGVFYAAPAPGADPYVTIGSKVKKGDVLCIIEAMKLMNEITAETDGEIVDICVKDGDIVEFGQVLFKIF